MFWKMQIILYRKNKPISLIWFTKTNKKIKNKKHKIGSLIWLCEFGGMLNMFNPTSASNSTLSASPVVLAPANWFCNSCHYLCQGKEGRPKTEVTSPSHVTDNMSGYFRNFCFTRNWRVMNFVLVLFLFALFSSFCCIVKADKN